MGLLIGAIGDCFAVEELGLSHDLDKFIGKRYVDVQNRTVVRLENIDISGDKHVLLKIENGKRNSTYLVLVCDYGECFFKKDANKSNVDPVIYLLSDNSILLIQSENIYISLSSLEKK